MALLFTHASLFQIAFEKKIADEHQIRCALCSLKKNSANEKQIQEEGNEGNHFLPNACVSLSKEKNDLFATVSCMLSFQIWNTKHSRAT